MNIYQKSQKQFDGHNSPVSSLGSVQVSFLATESEIINQYFYLKSPNSLLLSVNNLKNFDQQQKELPKSIFEKNPNIILKPGLSYAANSYPIMEYQSKMLENIRSITLQSSNLTSFESQKELDDISMASTNTTTNFTGKLINTRVN